MGSYSSSFVKALKQAENCKGFKSIRSDNKSGYVGIARIHKQRQYRDKLYQYTYWVAYINNKAIGYFKTKEDAIIARKEAYAHL
jgi:hypothetical protein